MGAFDEVAVDMSKVASWLSVEGLTRLTHAAAGVVKEENIRASVRAIGGDRRMRNFAGGRARAGVGYDIVRPGEATMNYRPSGMWQLLEYGAKAHKIGGPTSRGRRKGKRSILSINGQLRLGPVPHPGTRPKQVVTKARERADSEIPKAVEAALAAELERLLR